MPLGLARPLSCLRCVPVATLLAPPGSDDWLGITEECLPVGEVVEWAVQPQCGAVVSFSGTVRDHDEEFDHVERLEYEVYEDVACARLADLAVEIRCRWPMIGRLAMIHRVGMVELSETAVVVVASAPHRPEAFAAASFAIDAVKATIPIWKCHHVDGQRSWSKCSHPLVGADEVSRS